ncbi:MAG: hypothetical protein J6D15_05340 [Clostridia bacterium]|nr:hypothetical protein [Clostridia bacterium]
MEENPDFSMAVEKLQEMLGSEDGQSQIQNLLGLFASGNGENAESREEDTAKQAAELFGDGGMDLSSIMQMGGIMSAISGAKQNSHTAFLNALKPLLKQSRRKKLDQAAQLMKMTAVFKAFKENRQGGV